MAAVLPTFQGFLSWTRNLFVQQLFYYKTKPMKVLLLIGFLLFGIDVEYLYVFG